MGNKMGIKIEERGRILIPKNVRDEIGLRIGEEVKIEVKNNGIVVRPFKPLKELSSELRGCVKDSKIDPLKLKKMWEM